MPVATTRGTGRSGRGVPRHCLSCVLLLLIGAGALAPGARSQTVAFRSGSRGDPAADEAVQKVLSRGHYQLFTRDTILAADDVVAGDVVILRASLHLEGTVEGDIVAAQADVFARPGSRIGGVLVILNGGFYGSSLAEISAPPIDAAALDYQVQQEGQGGQGGQERYVIAAPGGSAAASLPGLYGFVLPAYDRVNALTISWGVDLEPGRSHFVPRASGRVRVRSARGVVDGIAELTWLFGRNTTSVNGGVTVRTRDRWIIGDAGNSLQAVVAAADLRNYYKAEFIDTGVRLNHGSRWVWSHGLGLSWERASSLPNEDPFSIFSTRGGFQANLSVDPGDIVSAKLDTRLRLRTWQGSDVNIELDIELADRDLAGDFTLALFGAALRADIGTTGDQKLIVLARGQVPTSEAPRQRWRALGGWRTLPTLNRLEQVGDRMWFVEATYQLPTRLGLGSLGRLEGYLQYAVGNSWQSGTTRPRVVGNLGAGLAVGWVALGIYTDPGNDLDTVVLLGIRRR